MQRFAGLAPPGLPFRTGLYGGISGQAVDDREVVGTVFVGDDGFPGLDTHYIDRLNILVIKVPPVLFILEQ